MSPLGAPRPSLDRARLTGPGGVDEPGLGGWRVEVVDVAASTNAVVGGRARAGADDGLVVVAEHQSAARGRLGRSWHAPPRSALLLSVLLRPTAPAGRWPWLPLVTGYAVARTVRAGGLPAGLKWPNDVLIGGPDGERKVAGILVERVETSRGPAAVVGIGLNVSLSADELPVPHATSLLLAHEVAGRGSAVPDRTDLLLDLLGTLRHETAVWAAGGPAAEQQAAAYVAACRSVGRPVRVELPAAPDLVGRAVGVDPGGRLLVETGAGLTAVAAGDVVHARLTPPGGRADPGPPTPPPPPGQ